MSRLVRWFNRKLAQGQRAELAHLVEATARDRAYREHVAFMRANYEFAHDLEGY